MPVPVISTSTESSPFGAVISTSSMTGLAIVDVYVNSTVSEWLKPFCATRESVCSPGVSWALSVISRLPSVGMTSPDEPLPTASSVALAGTFTTMSLPPSISAPSSGLATTGSLMSSATS